MLLQLLAAAAAEFAFGSETGLCFPNQSAGKQSLRLLQRTSTVRRTKYLLIFFFCAGSDSIDHGGPGDSRRDAYSER